MMFVIMKIESYFFSVLAIKAFISSDSNCFFMCASFNFSFRGSTFSARNSKALTFLRFCFFDKVRGDGSSALAPDFRPAKKLDAWYCRDERDLIIAALDIAWRIEDDAIRNMVGKVLFYLCVLFFDDKT